MNKILITGGAGFIGSHLCKELLKDKNNKVICLDNFYTGSHSNIKELEKNPNFTLMYKDVTDVTLINEDYFKGLTHIYNCACPASPVHYQKEHAIDTTLTCVLGVKNMLDLATKYGAKIMQFSTSEVYGEPDKEYQNESDRGSVNCIGPRACYDEGKRCAESLCFDYHRIYGTKIKVIRIFNTYGPNMNKDDGRVVSNFICQALQNKDITLYGRGYQTRSFCYISDLINAIVEVMNTSDNFIGPINLGNPIENSMITLAKMILVLTESKSKLVYKDLPIDDPTHRKPDITLAINTLKWRPQVYLKDGLLKTIEYFRGILK